MEHRVDLSRWARADQYHFFRRYDRPHFATTARIDITRVMRARAQDRAQISPYRASLFAIGAGVHGVPELLMRFRGDQVIRHDSVALSMTVPTANYSFSYAYVPFHGDFTTFDKDAKRLIDAASKQSDLSANTGERDDLVYLSCLPWIDYSSINNALPGSDDCIPRISWGRIVEDQGRHSMAMTLEVHHALADGAHVGAYFAQVQSTLDDLPIEALT